MIAISTASERLTLNPVQGQHVMLKPLTGVRAVAALWVVIGHFTPQIMKLFPSFGYVAPITTSGYLGVDLFFVLSGFILTHTYLSQFATPFSSQQYGRFLWLRLARMYPVHLFTMLILLLGVVAGGMLHFSFNMPERFHAIDFARNLLLIHAWGFSKDVSWNAPAWSISAEWFAYLLFPFAMLFIARLRSTVSCVIGAMLCYAILLIAFGMRGYSWTALANDMALVRVGTQFLAGCLIYRIYQSKLRPPIRWEVVSVILVFAILAYSMFFPPTRLISLAPAPLMGVLILSLAQERGPGGIAALLSTRVMIFCGEASYALYMTHEIVRLMLGKMLNADRYASSGFITRAAVLAVFIVAVSGAAVATFLLIETPSRRFMRSLLGQTKPVAGPSREIRGPVRVPGKRPPKAA